MYWFTLQHMFLSSWFLSSVFQTSKVKSKGWGNASVDLDEMRGNCRLLYGFYMLSIWFTIVIHYHSMYILPMNPQAAGPTTGWKTRRQTGMGMVGGWALSLPYLAFLKLKFGQFDYTRLTGSSLVDPQQNLKSCSFTIMYGQQWWIMVSQWSIKSEPTGNLSLSNSSIQKVVFHYPIGYWLYIWYYMVLSWSPLFKLGM